MKNSEKPVNASNEPSAELPMIINVNLGEVTIPGERFWIAVTNKYTGASSHLNQVPPQGIPGLYQVTFVLGKPGTRSTAENQIKFAQFVRGDSYVAMLPPALTTPAGAEPVSFKVVFENETWIFEGHANDAGFLAKLGTQTFHALSRRDAELRSTRVAQMFLSGYSAHLDIPIQIVLIEVTELATVNKSISLTAPFQSVPIPAANILGAYDPEFSRLAALYREALISNTPAYRFLCFYKVMESSRIRRERLGRKLKKDYRPLREGEVIPSSELEQVAWLGALFDSKGAWGRSTLDRIFPRETHGKKITALFDTKLRHIRDQIAHGILDSGQSLQVDDYEAVQEIAKWLPFLRCAVRRTLKNDFPEHYLTISAIT